MKYMSTTSTYEIRNLESNSNTLAHNSFAALADNEIMLRASLTGVKIPNNNFEIVDLVRN